MRNIESLTKKIIFFRDARDWAQFHNPKDVAISLSLEAAELLEHFQWKNPAEIAAHLKTHKTEVSEELADVLYWVLLLSHDLKIDPLAAPGFSQGGHSIGLTPPRKSLSSAYGPKDVEFSQG